MKKLLAILTFCISLTSYGYSKQIVDTSRITILPYDSTQNWQPFNNCKPAQLSVQDFGVIDSLLMKCINDYNTEQEKRFNEMKAKYPKDTFDKQRFIIDLKNYIRQYIVVKNSKGEKEVWINCSCVAFNFWKKEIIEVSDGGNCFFNLKINLTTGKYYDLFVNGEA